jgi:protocatechuate 3,4-dioxygenase beta subunit
MGCEDYLRAPFALTYSIFHFNFISWGDTVLIKEGWRNQRKQKMDNDDALVGRILSRREALTAMARAGLVFAGGGWIAGVARGSDGPTNKKVHLVASPELTEGPFFVDEKLNRSDLVAGSTRLTVANGLPLHLSFSVYKLVGKDYKPLSGAHVDVWHADVAGVYSDESNPMNHEDTGHQTWLRGYQVTDANGIVRFKTIFPGWYPGRCPHIHFKVRTYSSANKSTAEFTSQVFFRDKDADKIYTVEPYASRISRDTTNESDGVFTERQFDGSMAGSHMLLDLVKAEKTKGYATQFAIVLTDGNLKAGSRGRGPGGPGGPPPMGPSRWRLVLAETMGICMINGVFI